MLPFLMSEMMRGSPCFLLAAEGDDITLSSHNIQQSTYVQHYCQIQELLLLLLTIRIRNRTVSLSVINSVICKLLTCWDDGGEEVKSIKMCFFKWKTKELYTTWVLRLNFFQTWLHLIFLPSLSWGKNRPSLQLNLCHLMFLTFNILLLTVSCEHSQPEDGATAPSVPPVVIKSKWKLWDAGRRQHFITSVIFICCVFTDLPAV